jgi:hypothetical protein
MNKKLISATIGALVLSHQIGMVSPALARHANLDAVTSDLMKLDRLVQAEDSKAIVDMLSENEWIASLVKDVLPEGVLLADTRALSKKSLRDYGVKSHEKEKKKAEKRKEKRHEKDNHQY